MKNSSACSYFGQTCIVLSSMLINVFSKGNLLFSYSGLTDKRFLVISFSGGSLQLRALVVSWSYRATLHHLVTIIWYHLKDKLLLNKTLN